MPKLTIDQYKGFKLISLELHNDKIFGNINYEFVESNDAQDGIYTTIVIGPNGTRKSQLFKRIVDLYWDLYSTINHKISPRKYDFEFSLKYSYDNIIYQYSNYVIEQNLPSKVDTYLTKGEDMIIWGDVKLKNQIEFPENIIGSSVMVNDKFPHPDKEEFPKYEYLGTRFSRQMASTKTLINRTVEIISRLSDNGNFINGLNKIVSNFFNIEHDVYVVYYTKNTRYFFNGHLGYKSFVKYFEDIEKKYLTNNKKAPFSIDHFKKIKKDENLITELVDYLNYLATNRNLRKFYRSPSKAISFKLNEESDLDELKKGGELFTHLRQLSIVSPPEIEFLKPMDDINNLVGYGLLDSSSGEHNLLCSFIGFLASIKHKSLVLIDEPEVSLHPNWQMKYINVLRELFSGELYSNCHVIIATHSHFLVSDVIEPSSKVIGLTREPILKIIDMPRNYDTFGWSAEDVLYNIFNVRSSLNYYLQADLTELLGMIANNNIDQKERIKEILEKLKKLPVRKNDPLQDIIVEADAFLNLV